MEKIYRHNRASTGKKMAEGLKYEREKLITQYRDQQGMTLESIGTIFGLTRERVRQIYDSHRVALDKKK
jgi:DNA-directed RNA polymerase sigma subunit (sigma70/sigma32)